MLHHVEIADRDVWITVEAPLIPDNGSGGFIAGGFWVSAFRFDTLPGVITGEFVKDGDGRTSRFSSSENAPQAAIAETSNRLSNI